MTDIPAGFSPGFSTSTWSTEALVDLIVAVNASGNFNGAVITNSTIDSSVIGGATPGAGHFSTLSASGAVALATTLGVTGASTLHGVTATTLTATGATVLSNASVSMTALPTADPHVVGVLWANSHVLTVSAG